MKVAELMTRHVEFIAGEASAGDAAVLMGELDVGALPVGTAEQLEGIVTDRDILYRVVAAGLVPAAVRLRDIASHPVIGCGEEDSLPAAMDLMAAHHIRRLAVRDAAGRVVGWLTLADLARQLLVGSDTVQQELKALTEAEA
ncbi:MAG: CBS domain-containing protein [Dongiaceae bacterium]